MISDSVLTKYCKQQSMYNSVCSFTHNIIHTSYRLANIITHRVDDVTTRKVNVQNDRIDSIDDSKYR